MKEGAWRWGMNGNILAYEIDDVGGSCFFFVFVFFVFFVFAAASVP